jgi:hypothetical protein
MSCTLNWFDDRYPLGSLSGMDSNHSHSILAMSAAAESCFHLFLTVGYSQAHCLIPSLAAFNRWDDQQILYRKHQDPPLAKYASESVHMWIYCLENFAPSSVKKTLSNFFAGQTHTLSARATRYPTSQSSIAVRNCQGELNKPPGHSVEDPAKTLWQGTTCVQILSISIGSRLYGFMQIKHLT